LLLHETFTRHRASARDAGENFMSVSSIASSGLRASLARINASAANAANVNSTTTRPARTGATQEAYQPVSTVDRETIGGGVSFTYAPERGADTSRYDPESAAANSEGIVAPKVDLVKEQIDLLKAKTSFLANVAVLRTDNHLQSSIDLLG
jgi:flagellar basal-body rod protein FlgC